MSQRAAFGEPWLRAWLRFWFDLPSLTTLALMRIGVGTVLFYSLFVFSLDLTTHLAPGGWGDLGTLRASDPVAWPFSLFDWVDAIWWMWSVHFTAMVLAALFTVGVVPSVTGWLSVIFYLSYGHRNPAVMVGLDGLLVLALIYLSLAPTGRVLSVLPKWERRPSRHRPSAPPLSDQPQRPAWGAFMLRIVQIHVCLIYLLSGLRSMFPEWLSGEMLTHPRLLERGFPLSGELFTASGAWSMGIAHGLTVATLFYGILIWLPRFRYPVVGVMVTLHLVVGFMWGLQAFNVAMIVLNLAFLDSDHLEWVRRRLLALPTLPWLAGLSRL